MSNCAPPTTDPQRLTVVIAGNYQQFLVWCHDHEISPRSREVIYATPTSLRGRRNVIVERHGTWYDRPDLPEIEGELRFVNMAP